MPEPIDDDIGVAGTRMQFHGDLPGRGKQRRGIRQQCEFAAFNIAFDEVQRVWPDFGKKLLLRQVRYGRAAIGGLQADLKIRVAADERVEQECP